MTSIGFERVASNGVSLHAAVAGPTDGPLVLLLHGFPESWRAWERHLPAFASAGYRVVALDQRGYGSSDKPGGVRHYRMDELAADVLGVMDALGSARAHIVGHDWGAAVAWSMAIRNPDRVHKLVVMDVPHPDVMRRHLLRDPKQMLRSWYMAFFQLPALPEWLLRRNGCAMLRKVLVGTSRPGTFTPGQLDAYAAEWAQPNALTAMLNWYRAGRAELMVGERPAPAMIAPPTLMMWGKHDSAVRYQMAFDSAQLCRHVEIEILEECTHWLHHEEPERVQARILAFLA